MARTRRKARTLSKLSGICSSFIDAIIARDRHREGRDLDEPQTPVAIEQREQRSRRKIAIIVLIRMSWRCDHGTRSVRVKLQPDKRHRHARDRQLASEHFLLCLSRDGLLRGHESSGEQGIVRRSSDRPETTSSRFPGAASPIGHRRRPDQRRAQVDRARSKADAKVSR